MRRPRDRGRNDAFRIEFLLAVARELSNKYFPPRGTRAVSNNAAITRKQQRKIPLTGSKGITESPNRLPPPPPSSRIHFPPPAAHPFAQEKSKVRGNRRPVLFSPPLLPLPFPLTTLDSWPTSPRTLRTRREGFNDPGSSLLLCRLQRYQAP